MDDKDIERKMQEAWHSHATEKPHPQKQALWQEFADEAFPARKKSTEKWVYPAAAAVVLMLMGIGIMFYQTQNNAVSAQVSGYTIIENPSATIKLVTLPDSSVVELEPEAILKYNENFTENRAVKLNGKAFFNVHKDKKHPFTVQCHETTTTVLGTCFTIYGYNRKSVKVQLYEGRVQMNVTGKNNNWILAPGEQFVYENGNVDVASFNRFIDFNDTPLTEIIAHIKKTYGYETEIPDELKNKKVTLRLNRKEDLQNVVDILAQMYDIKPTINNKQKKLPLTKKLKTISIT